MSEKGTEVAVVEEVHLGNLDSNAIAKIKHDIELCHKLAGEVLVEGIDYGEIPGVKGKGLWDSGASKIIRSYECHAEHKILIHEENEEVIGWTIEALLIHNESGKIIGSGLGSCSTREAKYGYRWVKNPKNFGYSDEAIKELRYRAAYGGEIEYRIDNPDAGDLINTLLVMACKRAEVDAAKSLPGVIATLKPIFEGSAPKKQGPVDEEMSYKDFYTFFNACGVSIESVHKALEVKSLKDWVAAGKTLKEAQALIVKKLVALTAKRKVEPPPPQPPQTPPTHTPDHTGDDLFKESKENFELWEIITPDEIKTIDDLLRAGDKCWGLTEEEIWLKLRYKDRANFTHAGVQTAWDAFVELKETQLKK